MPMNLRYSSPIRASLNTDQARSSVNGLFVGTLSTSPSWTNSNTKYNESSSGSSSTSTNLTTFGWSNCLFKWTHLLRCGQKRRMTSTKFSIPFSIQQFRDKHDPAAMFLSSVHGPWVQLFVVIYAWIEFSLRNVWNLLRNMQVSPNHKSPAQIACINKIERKICHHH